MTTETQISQEIMLTAVEIARPAIEDAAVRLAVIAAANLLLATVALQSGDPDAEIERLLEEFARNARSKVAATRHCMSVAGVQ